MNNEGQASFSWHCPPMLPALFPLYLWSFLSLLKASFSYDYLLKPNRTWNDFHELTSNSISFTSIYDPSLAKIMKVPKKSVSDFNATKSFEMLASCLTQESFNPFIVPYTKYLPEKTYPRSEFPIYSTALGEKIGEFIDAIEVADRKSNVSNSNVLNATSNPRAALIQAKEIDCKDIESSKNLFGATAIMTPILVAILTNAIGKGGLRLKKSDEDAPGYKPWAAMVDNIKNSKFYIEAKGQNLLIYPLMQTFFDRHYLASGQTHLMYTDFEMDFNVFVTKAENEFISIAKQKKIAEQEQIELEREREEKEQRQRDVEEEEAAERERHSEKPKKHVRFNNQLQIFKFQKDNNSSASKLIYQEDSDSSAPTPKEEKPAIVDISKSNKSSYNNSLNIIVVSVAIIVIAVLGFVYVQFYR
jgi:hypothetical protein